MRALKTAISSRECKRGFIIGRLWGAMGSSSWIYSATSRRQAFLSRGELVMDLFGRAVHFKRGKRWSSITRLLFHLKGSLSN